MPDRINQTQQDDEQDKKNSREQPQGHTKNKQHHNLRPGTDNCKKIGVFTSEIDLNQYENTPIQIYWKFHH